MAIKNVQQLLAQQSGKARVDAISTTAMTGKDYGIIYFLTDSVVSSIAVSNVQSVTGSTEENVATSYSAGATLFLDVTSITLSSGSALCYYNEIV